MAVHKTRILHVIGAMDRGGAESLIMSIYRAIDRDKFSFDFLINEKYECDYNEEIRSLGGQIYYVPRFVGTNLPQYLEALKAFFAQHHDYDVVHVHIGSAAALVIPCAQKYGIYAVAHSHNTNGSLSPFGLVLRCVSWPTRFLADYYLGCSYQAGLDRFGKAVVSSKRFSVCNNGIDMKAYRFDPKIRAQYRAELGISSDTKAICHVGRFAEQKNHQFLIEAFSCAVNADPCQELFLFGRGPLEQDIKAEVERLGIANKVHFLGVRDEINKYLMAMDVFVFPSKWEGLGIALIEAQASGLPCLISPTLVEEGFCAPYVEKLPDLVSAETWGNRISSTYSRSDDERYDGASYVAKAGFDINDTVEMLSNLYEIRPYRRR